MKKNVFEIVCDNAVLLKKIYDEVRQSGERKKMYISDNEKIFVLDPENTLADKREDLHFVTTIPFKENFTEEEREMFFLYLDESEYAIGEALNNIKESCKIAAERKNSMDKYYYEAILARKYDLEEAYVDALGVLTKTGERANLYIDKERRIYVLKEDDTLPERKPMFLVAVIDPERELNNDDLIMIGILGLGTYRVFEGYKRARRKGV